MKILRRIFRRKGKQENAAESAAKEQPESETPILTGTAIPLSVALEVDGRVFYELPIDVWMRTSRYIGAASVLKVRELFNMTVDQYHYYDQGFDDIFESAVETMNEIAMGKSDRIRAKQMAVLQSKISRLKLHRENLKASLSLLDVPELYYRIAVHCLFLAGDDPSKLLNFEEQERRIELLKKKGWISVASLDIVKMCLGLEDSFSTSSLDAFQMTTEQHRFLRETLGLIPSGRASSA